jgi:hypothetical protein
MVGGNWDVRETTIVRRTMVDSITVGLNYWVGQLDWGLRTN